MDWANYIAQNASLYSPSTGVSHVLVHICPIVCAHLFYLNINQASISIQYGTVISEYDGSL
jgi:hypothetical protein